MIIEGGEICQYTVIGRGDKTPLAMLLDWYSLGLFDIFLMFNDQIISIKHFYFVSEAQKFKNYFNAIIWSFYVQKISKSPKLYQSKSMDKGVLSPPPTTVHC